ncbi:hypothetical protein [Micromonospora sp. NPDC049891]|uniref:hypothetical protein n=1 Tax=Micromonospora sp. NPDC049891 TaxID=3155655 RepID=UPI0033D89219
MNDLEDTGAIIARQHTETIVKLLEQRATAQPPRWMTTATKAVCLLAAGDIGVFAIHATITHQQRPGIGVALGLHLAFIAVVVLAAVLLGGNLARIRLDNERAAQQDQLDAYRQQRTITLLCDAIAEQPGIIRAAVRDVMNERDREQARERWLGLAAHARDDLGLHTVDNPPGGGDGDKTTVIRLPHGRTPGRRSG